MIFTSLWDALRFLVAQHGNDYIERQTNDYEIEYCFKSSPDTFGDGPYVVRENPDGKFELL